jgi:hypothetical protein
VSSFASAKLSNKGGRAHRHTHLFDRGDVEQQEPDVVRGQSGYRPDDEDGERERDGGARPAS